MGKGPKANQDKRTDGKGGGQEKGMNMKYRNMGPRSSKKARDSQVVEGKEKETGNGEDLEGTNI